jgi:hypothetical protein
LDDDAHPSQAEIRLELERLRAENRRLRGLLGLDQPGETTPTPIQEPTLFPGRAVRESPPRPLGLMRWLWSGREIWRLHFPSRELSCPIRSSSRSRRRAENLGFLGANSKFVGPTWDSRDDQGTPVSGPKRKPDGRNRRGGKGDTSAPASGPDMTLAAASGRPESCSPLTARRAKPTMCARCWYEKTGGQESWMRHKSERTRSRTRIAEPPSRRLSGLLFESVRKSTAFSKRLLV